MTDAWLEGEMVSRSLALIACVGALLWGFEASAEEERAKVGKVASVTDMHDGDLRNTHDRERWCPIDRRLLSIVSHKSSEMWDVIPLTPQVFASREGDLLAISPGCSFTLESAGWYAANDPSFNYRIRSAIGVAGLLGIATANYWIGQDQNAVDWELSWTWPSWEKKVSSIQGISLDANRFETNAVWHPVAGTLYYLAARGNFLSVPESYAVSFLASMFWEYVVEYREKVSINDLIVTPAAGVAIGEPLHQMALYLERSTTPFAEGVAAVVSPFHALVDHDVPPAKEVDSLGLPTDGWHEFEFFLGGSTHVNPQLTASAPESQVGLKAAMITIADYERPVKVQQAMAPGSSFALSLEMGFAEGDMIELDAVSRVGLGGYFWQDLASTEGERLGYHLALGGAAGYEYTVHTWGSGFVDKLGVVNLGGISMNVGVDRHPLRIHAGVDVFADFAAVRSLAIDDFIASEGSKGLSLLLSDKRYYFAVGTTVHPKVSISYRGAEVGGAVQLDLFKSIQGLDRNQASVTQDIALVDSRLSEEVWLSYQPPGEHFRISVQGEHLERVGHAAGVRAALEETKGLAGFSVVW